MFFVKICSIGAVMLPWLNGYQLKAEENQYVGL